MRRIPARWAVGLGVLAACALLPRPGGSPATPPTAEAADGALTLVEAWPGCGFDRPIAIAAARDGTDRVFVAQRGGKVLVLPKWRGAGPVAKPKVFLDLSSLMTERTLEMGQGGLLTVAVPPDYKTSGRLAVFYGTGTEKPDNPFRTVVALYKRSAADPDVGDPASATIVLSVKKAGVSHFGGGLSFGADGTLYVGIGDSGLKFDGKGDPSHMSQDTRVLEGKILRLDVSASTAAKPYAIPADNPWATGQGGVRPEIWAFGVRNPWRFSFDRDTGNLWMGDPGQQKREEVDVVPRGRNMGWAMMEGDLALTDGAKAADYVAPVFAYGRELGSCVIGGVVYRGKRCSGIAGHYVFADHMSGKIVALPVAGAATSGPHKIVAEKEAIASIDEDAQGELLLCCLDEDKVYTLAPAP